ncbi:MAG: YczE/YyaS/YitT family protein [Ruminococcus sp.]|jgi:uncharacterized membrane protein YczE
MRKAMVFRGIFYAAGLLILALGLTLNTRTGLGVSPIISVAYSVSSIFNWNLGNMTLILYCVFVLVELILHTRVRQRKSILLMDIFQIPLSIIFTRFINIFSGLLPDMKDDNFGIRVVFLLIAIMLTGIGAAMSLNMRLVPNPGDGIVQVISDCDHKSVGFNKNWFDLINIIITTAISFIFAGHLVGIGVGTLLAVIGVGRSIAVFNHFFHEKMVELAGIKQCA